MRTNTIVNYQVNVGLYELGRLKSDYRLKKQGVHGRLWLKEIEKLEENKLSGDGGDCYDIEKVLDSCSELVNKGCKLIRCGSTVPKLQISNDELAEFVETSDEWISSRTGIRNRRVLSGEDSLIGLATEASQKALQMAQVDPDDIDLILMCTSTRTYLAVLLRYKEHWDVAKVYCLTTLLLLGAGLCWVWCQPLVT